jgi:hypothetical protein
MKMTFWRPTLQQLKTFSLVALTATSLGMMAATTSPTPAVAQQIGRYSIDPNIALDGDWRLSWRSNGIIHRAQLSMDGNFGTMFVNARLPNGRLIAVQERMRLTPTSRGFVLRGSRPTYPGTGTPHPSYNPDVFQIRPISGSSLNVTNCSGGFCVPVSMRRS